MLRTRRSAALRDDGPLMRQGLAAESCFDHAPQVVSNQRLEDLAEELWVLREPIGVDPKGLARQSRVGQVNLGARATTRPRAQGHTPAPPTGQSWQCLRPEFATR